MADLHKHLCTAVENTAIGEVLGSVQEEDVESMYLLYLHDFVRFEHTCNHKQQAFMDREYHVILHLLPKHPATACKKVCSWVAYLLKFETSRFHCLVYIKLVWLQIGSINLWSVSYLLSCICNWGK